MSIPSNIKREHILKAIDKINNEGIPVNAHSSTYDVVFNEKKYPPKLVISYANLYANNFELDRSTFEGGFKTESFKILRKNGFIIEPKDKSFFETLLNFLNQAQSNNLSTKSFKKEYKGLDLVVSFGKGNIARIPWLAFVRSGQRVINGIYPVYLYYKSENLLILAYGISETNETNFSWNLPSSIQTIENLFVKKFKAKPIRYGSSYVHSFYEVDKDLANFNLNPIKIESDLQDIINTYKKLPLDNYSLAELKNYNLILKKFNYSSFVSDSTNGGLLFPEKLILRFISSLCTKPFVILTGLSGSGKTKLAQAFSHWICEDESQVCIVPVGADWTNREPLLGYPNALEPDKYAIPENGAINILIEANKEKNAAKPYFLILDEMNLSHVERYFADFLSAMESKEAIPLHSFKDDLSGVPSKIHLPPNLFLIGTVNIDETTYMFSPKVLDRANVIEFRVTPDEMSAYLSGPGRVDLPSLRAKGADMAEDFVKIAGAHSSGFSEPEDLKSALMEFFSELKKVGAEFGYRTASEINRFAEITETLKTGWPVNEVIDAAIIQKLLPKIHGSRRKIEPGLKALAKLCLSNSSEIDTLLNNPDSINFEDQNIKYPVALEKIIRMHKAVVQDGFTSFAEA